MGGGWWRGGGLQIPAKGAGLHKETSGVFNAKSYVESNHLELLKIDVVSVGYSNCSSARLQLILDSQLLWHCNICI